MTVLPPLLPSGVKQKSKSSKDVCQVDDGRWRDTEVEDCDC